MDTGPTRIVVLGRIGGPFAVQGWLKVASYTEPRENLLDYATWHVGRNGEWRVMKVETGRAHGGATARDVLVKLAGIDNPEIARTLTGSDVGVERAALPALPDGEYYWDDLLGFDAYSPQGEWLGRLDHFAQSTAHGLMVLHARGDDPKGPGLGTGREILVPMVHDRILEVNPEGARLTLDWQLDWS